MHEIILMHHVTNPSTRTLGACGYFSKIEKVTV